MAEKKPAFEAVQFASRQFKSENCYYSQKIIFGHFYVDLRIVNEVIVLSGFSRHFRDNNI